MQFICNAYKYFLICFLDAHIISSHKTVSDSQTSYMYSVCSLQGSCMVEPQVETGNVEGAPLVKRWISVQGLCSTGCTGRTHVNVILNVQRMKLRQILTTPILNVQRMKIRYSQQQRKVHDFQAVCSLASEVKTAFLSESVSLLQSYRVTLHGQSILMRHFILLVNKYI